MIFILYLFKSSVDVFFFFKLLSKPPLNSMLSQSSQARNSAGM